ncbi:hypothetical protein DFH09DRAFT_1301008, partial [Mycena vulgaris]
MPSDPTLPPTAAHPAFAQSVGEHNRLSRFIQYAAVGVMVGAHAWRKFNSGNVLRQKRDGPALPGQEIEQFGHIVVVGVVSDNNPALSVVGNYRHGLTDDITKSKYTLMLNRPHDNPVFAAAWDSAVLNLREVEGQICKKTEHFWADDRGETAIRLGMPTFGKKKNGKPDVDFSVWPIPEECRAIYTKTLQTLDIKPLRVYDVNNSRVAATDIASVLPGALVRVTFTMRFVSFPNKMKQGQLTNSLNGEMQEVVVIERAPPPPADLFSGDGPFLSGAAPAAASAYRNSPASHHQSQDVGASRVEHVMHGLNPEGLSTSVLLQSRSTRLTPQISCLQLTCVTVKDCTDSELLAATGTKRDTMEASHDDHQVAEGHHVADGYERPYEAEEHQVGPRGGTYPIVPTDLNALGVVGSRAPLAPQRGTSAQPSMERGRPTDAMQRRGPASPYIQRAPPAVGRSGPVSPYEAQIDPVRRSDFAHTPAPSTPGQSWTGRLSTRRASAYPGPPATFSCTHSIAYSKPVATLSLPLTGRSSLSYSRAAGAGTFNEAGYTAGAKIAVPCSHKGIDRAARTVPSTFHVPLVRRFTAHRRRPALLSSFNTAPHAPDAAQLSFLSPALRGPSVPAEELAATSSQYRREDVTYPGARRLVDEAMSPSPFVAEPDVEAAHSEPEETMRQDFIQNDDGTPFDFAEGVTGSTSFGEVSQFSPILSAAYDRPSTPYDSGYDVSMAPLFPTAVPETSPVWADALPLFLAPSAAWSGESTGDDSDVVDEQPLDAYVRIREESATVKRKAQFQDDAVVARKARRIAPSEYTSEEGDDDEESLPIVSQSQCLGPCNTHNMSTLDATLALPDEIVAEVFRALVYGGALDDWVAEWREKVRAALACRRWRDVLYGTPSLWARINIRLFTTPTSLEFYLERAKNTPTNIIVDAVERTNVEVPRDEGGTTRRVVRCQPLEAFAMMLDYLLQ